ncbi:sodium-dependent glucose transporter 1A-like [Pecten maximus]|uniref:sodium-dependent glucose transporter 1A-like n=1 Tax=Pecten maximus TaxID=6579 RepID=UPI00145805F0|nr:sodium-dependent glucose transporter 1A-like [Pecten maximus]XP_033762271.1 sodium-dependent glucose transporter 1A-like [Pecten maximus]
MEVDKDNPRSESRIDKTRRHNILYSINIYASFLMIGWSRGLFGPSFPDIQHICQVDLELGSWIVTTFFIGNTFGSLTAGLLGKVERKLIFGLSLITLATSVAIIPWCSVYGVMIAAHLVQGFCQGIVDTIGNSEILLLWKDNRLLYFCLELNYNIGSFAAPMITAPFLMDIPVVTNANSTYPQPFIYNNSLTISDGMNGTYVVPPLVTTSQSKIYIPYSLTAFICICISISFSIMHFVFQQRNRANNDRKNKREPENETFDLSEEGTLKSRHKPRQLSAKVKGFSLATMSVLLLFYDGVEETFVSYLTIYCVNYLKWSPSQGALITSITNICGLVAIVASLFMKCINTMVYAGVNCVFMFLSFLGILLSSLYYHEVGMWISCCFHGFFRSMLFSLIFTWTNDYITPVTGRIASLFMISTCIGAAVNPVMLGNIMERFGDIWLCYGFAAEGFILLLLYFGMVGITRYVVKHFGKNIDESHTYETTISVTETFIKESDNYQESSEIRVSRHV